MNKPQSKSQQDTTIDSEVEELLKIPLVGGDIQDLADGINRLIAQEANKARIDELKRHQGEGGWIDIEEGEVSERIEELQNLTADKEQA